MILYNKYVNGVDYCLYDSSNVLYSEFCEQKKVLRLMFKNGYVYSYELVLFEDYVRFKTSSSTGVAVREFISTKYPGVRLYKHDIRIALDMIEELKRIDAPNEDGTQKTLVMEVSEDGNNYAIMKGDTCISSGAVNNVNVVNLLAELSIPYQMVKVEQISESRQPRVIGGDTVLSD